MKTNEFQNLILSEIQELKKEMKAVRQEDIPQLRIDMALVKDKASKVSYIISGIGGLISTAVAIAMAKLSSQ